MKLLGKKILLGVSGGIAAYKIPNLVRLLKKNGAEVQVLMTASAAEFASPLALATVSENKVLTEIFPDSAHEAKAEWTCHISLGEWADLFVIAPATANTIGKLASGLCDDMLSAAFLTLRPAKPRLIFPSMDGEMYFAKAVQRNLAQLKADGCEVIEPETGSLASGLTGMGRMPDPETIFDRIVKTYDSNEDAELCRAFDGKNVVVTAGATREKIDDVRFISNYSSGKMGFALAASAAKLGAKVTLITGKTALQTPQGVQRIDVESAREMLVAAEAFFTACDMFIAAAAVADYRPASPHEGKIKKSENVFEIQLVKNPDILQLFGTQKSSKQVAIGFALEAQNPMENAKEKLAKKNLDLIVLNSASEPGAGFEVDTNVVTLIGKDGTLEKLPLMSKLEVAKVILKKSSFFFGKDMLLS
ncbi:phosphopantothenoylcysteine decarboxylase/phosphopantothenate/cysteine ligase [Chloroherpeton thalassium ATCC 35110]|uniref:Coenzyme A biosynthesis bifunctional protein CoaBC n=1 Tax=Chloroherpeton thalassium (strain ATCC 35110 / GB-78) TaxID=517418 RepID=B3QUE6_CHLT3|nr:bifunctional phosphopantothenoylcysteine decarboxylase/phosphopantothenate--cysteine ligase CoaBC [Chloroherpeton thalassium]ACF14395.1 phosphopantothenoylcysteine decarboxylase/phosphopantothenate/cysteine ligase [Chloroherpeton thalassium ATCC 35110]